MPVPTVNTLRERFPALCFVALLHIAVIYVLLHAMPELTGLIGEETEAKVSLLPILMPQPVPKKRIRRSSAARRGAITAPFNPDNFKPSMLAQPGLKGLYLALNACTPENLGNLSAAMREQCARIDTILFAGRDELPNALKIKHAAHWRAELLIKQTPQLLPCAKPTPPPKGMGIISVDLGTLICIADLLSNGYHPETAAHYSK